MEQIVRNKALKIFQEPEYDFHDIRIFKNDEKVCKIKDLIRT